MQYLLALAAELKRRFGGDAVNDFAGDLIEVQDFFCQAGARDKAGHAPDDAPGLILHDDRAPGKLRARPECR